MKTVFISISYAHSEQFTIELRVIAEVLRAHGFSPLLFAKRYSFGPHQARLMMTTAQAELGRAALLIAEVTYKAIGVGIEVGYAAALGKPIIYLRQPHAEYSTTVGGLATHTLIYYNPTDLREKLPAALGEVVISDCDTPPLPAAL